MTNTQDYKSDAVLCEYLSDAMPQELEALIGKTVSKIEAREYSFEITFTDGSKLETGGSRRDGCCLGVSVEPPFTTPGT